MEFLIFLFTFLFAVALVLGGYWRFFRRADSISQRLNDLDPVESASSPDQKDWDWVNVAGKIAEPLQKLIPISAEKRTRLEKKLLYAGYFAPQSFGIYRSLQLIALISFPLLVLLLWFVAGQLLSASVPWVLLALATGYLLPRQILEGQTKARQQRLRWGIADAMDLLVVSLEAGLGVPAALSRVSHELKKTHPEISREFELVNLEILVGQDRETALRHLAERTGVDDLRSFCATLIQADRFGTSVARAVRTYADALRVKRRQRAEQSAQKAAVKLLLPLALFLFPTLFIIILGPAFLQIMKNFTSQ